MKAVAAKDGTVKVSWPNPTNNTNVVLESAYSDESLTRSTRVTGKATSATLTDVPTRAVTTR